MHKFPCPIAGCKEYVTEVEFISEVAVVEPGSTLTRKQSVVRRQFSGICREHKRETIPDFSGHHFTAKLKDGWIAYEAPEGWQRVASAVVYDYEPEI